MIFRQKPDIAAKGLFQGLPRTRVKICGITRPEDGLAAVDAGADALGLVFYEPSPRAVSLEQARAVATAVPPSTCLVGLFVDAPEAVVKGACEQSLLDLLQFHGGESATYCEGFGLPWMKALRVAANTDVAAAIAGYPGAQAILLDTYSERAAGGTGERFDWSLVPDNPPLPLVLAGGLDAGNVGRAIAATRPWAVDVSGGVESAPGIKDAGKMRDFVAAVRAADRAMTGNE